MQFARILATEEARKHASKKEDIKRKKKATLEVRKIVEKLETTQEIKQASKE